MSLQSGFIGKFSLFTLGALFPSTELSCVLSGLLCEFVFSCEVKCNVIQTQLEKELLYFQARWSVGRELCKLCT